MKKCVMGIVGLLILLSVTGCGNFGTFNSDKVETKDENSGTLKCTKVETEDGKNIDDTMVVTYKDNKVTKVENTNVTEMDASMVDLTVSFGTAFASKLNELNGFNVNYSKIDDTKVKYVITVNFEELDVEQLKSTFGEDFDEESFYSSKDVSLDNFKENNLSDYTCE